MLLQQVYWLPALNLWIIPFHLLYLCLNFQAIIIIAKLSFWINKSFLASIAEALEQYKQEGYIQKLRTDITPDFLCSGHQDLVTLLYRQVTQTVGMYICLVMHCLWTIYGRVKHTAWYPGDLLASVLPYSKLMFIQT